MSSFATFVTAWDASTGSTRKVRAYLKQTLSSGMLQSATLGRLRPGHGYGYGDGDGDGEEQDMLAAVGSSLCLLRVDGPGMVVTKVCSTPIFSNILDIVCLHSPASMQQANTPIGKCQGEVNAGLAENGSLALVRVERFNDDGYRIRLVSEARAYMGLEDGSCLRMLRKLALDPLSRAICLVSWLDYIEFIYLDWSDSESTAQQCPVSLGVRLNVSVGGAICDAAILAPAKTELHRVLLVVAVVDSQRQSVFLHLYEFWTHPVGAPSAVLLAKLPLPFNMTMPVHVVPLPEHPECFLLVTENEIAFVSALQILSGDVYLHRQPLPRLSSGGCDLVNALCVAGTVMLSSSSAAGAESPHSRRSVLPRSPSMDSWRDSPLSETPRPSEAPPSLMAQNVYLAMQSGALLLASITSRPSIRLTRVGDTQQPTAADNSRIQARSGGVLLFLGAHTPVREAAQPARASDYLFASGDCLDHAIVKIVNGANTGALAAEEMPVRHTRPVLANQSPMIDFALMSSMAYWTSGRNPSGAVHRAQFGHAVRIEELIETRDSLAEAKAATCQLWHFVLPSSSPCLVLQRPKEAVAILMNDTTGEWQVCQALQKVVAKRRVVFVGSVGPAAASILCISSNTVEVWFAGALLGNIQPAKPLRLEIAQSTEIFTHGVIATSSQPGSSWAVLGVESMVDEPDASSGRHRRRRQSSIRVIAIPGEAYMSDGERVAMEMRFTHEISCVRSFTLGSNVYVAVGTYEPRLHLLRLDAELVSIGIDLPLSAPHGADEADRVDVDCSSPTTAPGRASHVINDICILCDSVASCILVGLRDGTLLQLALDGSLAADTMAEEKLHIANVTRDEVSTIPVQFARVAATAASAPASGKSEEYAGTDGARRAIVVAGSLFIADLKPSGQVVITPCFGDGQPLGRVRFAIPAAGEAGDCIGSRRYYAVDDVSDAINLLSIDFVAQCHIDELAVCCEPRRVICDPETDLLVVAGVLPQSPNAPFPTSCLTVLGPHDGRIHAECKLRPSELVHALEAWHIHGPRAYRYICVGTGMYPATGDGQGDPAPRAKSGRLIIYNLKAAKRKARPKTPTSSLPNTATSSQSDANPVYELRYVWESEREGPVSALAHMGDKYLVVAAGSSCLVLKLDVVQKRLIECCEIPLRFPATSLHVRKHDIVVGSQREGVHVLRFTPASSANSGSYDALHMLHSARYGVHTADAHFLSSNLVLGVSDSGYIYAMGIPSRSSEFALDYIMGVHLGSECTRIRQGSPVRRLRRPEHAQTWSTISASDDDCCVLVSTVDGALWTLLSITDDAFMLLHQLELAMVGMGPAHAAYPLLTVGESITRVRYESKLPVLGTVDGALSTAFVEGLTEAEQEQVVQSSPQLQRMALSLLTNSGSSSSQSQCHAAPDSTRVAVESIAQLINGLDRACVC